MKLLRARARAKKGKKEYKIYTAVVVKGTILSRVILMLGFTTRASRVLNSTASLQAYARHC